MFSIALNVERKRYGIAQFYHYSQIFVRSRLKALPVNLSH